MTASVYRFSCFQIFEDLGVLPVPEPAVFVDPYIGVAPVGYRANHGLRRLLDNAMRGGKMGCVSLGGGLGNGGNGRQGPGWVG